MTLPELELFISEFGKERYRAVQIMKWIHQGLADSFDGMTNLSKKLREKLSAKARISSPAVETVQISKDTTSKFLLKLDDGSRVETVLIPGEDHDTLCVSTQVGCAMGCRICRTAKMGFFRNLSAGEIASQLLIVRRKVPESRISNIVFMGMGEPLANFGETVRAISIMTHPNGPKISWRRLTVSTSGLIPGIVKLGKTIRVKLAVSLNAVTDDQRNAIMPINRKYPISELLKVLRSYPLPRGDRITIEYVLIDRFNDSDADARQLVRLLNPIRAKVNLIPLNDDVSEEFRSPSPERVCEISRNSDVPFRTGYCQAIPRQRHTCRMRPVSVSGRGRLLMPRLEALIRALSNPAVYPHQPQSVQVIQTHISVVFIAGKFVYKVKKPLNLGFLDFTTLEKRRHFCEQEVKLNSRFSEGIYLGVVSICQTGSGVNLSGKGEEIEVAVLMSLIPEDRIMTQYA